MVSDARRAKDAQAVIELLKGREIARPRLIADEV